MFINLVINIPIHNDGATPYLEPEIENDAKDFVSFIQKISRRAPHHQQALAVLLLGQHQDLFRAQEIQGVLLDPSTYSIVPQLPTPPDNHVVSLNSGPATASETPPCITWNTSFGVRPTAEEGQNDQSFDSLFNGVISILPDENLGPERLRSAKLQTDPRYHRGLELMLDYRKGNNDAPDLGKLAVAVQAGYASINPKLDKFTQTRLQEWAVHGLQPAQAGSIEPQCSSDLYWLGMGLDAETEVMMRRVVRVRLYYWYQRESRDIHQLQNLFVLERGQDIRSKAIDTLLSKVHDNWDVAPEEDKKARRKAFHYHKDIGKKWCELVRYLGEGILVICGKGLDAKLSNDFSAHDVHALATFVINCYPDVIKVARQYETIAKTFIQNQKLDSDQWTAWYGNVDREAVNVAIEAQKTPQRPGHWTQLDDHSKDGNLSNFVRTHLGPENTAERSA